MAAAERGVWTATQLRRLLAEEADYPLSAPSVGALLTGEPTQVRLSTLLALCTALRCTPNDLFDLDVSDAAASAASASDEGHGGAAQSSTRTSSMTRVARRQPPSRAEFARMVRVPAAAAVPVGAGRRG
jgi:putative transcriptional regulator